MPTNQPAKPLALAACLDRAVHECEDYIMTCLKRHAIPRAYR